MARTNIRIIACSEVHALPVELPGVAKITIPIDGKFHPVDSRLLPLLTDSAVEFEEGDQLADDDDQIAEEAGSEPASEAGGGDGLGGSDAAATTEGEELAAGDEPAPAPEPELKQLDRDGNGEPGGSLPGNDTVPAAKGKRKTRKG